MALYRCGGGGIDIFNPDLTWQVAATKTSQTISVSQKPKYIVVAEWTSAGSAYGGMLGLVDVANGSAKRMGYWSGANKPYGAWDNWASYFTSITASQVVFNAATWDSNNNSRIQILIYY